MDGLEQTRLQELFERWCDDAISEAEEQELAQLFASGDVDAELTLLMKQRWLLTWRADHLSNQDSIEMARRIFGPHIDRDIPRMGTVIHLFKKTWFRYAAVVLIAAGIGSYIWLSHKSLERLATTRVNQRVAAAIIPGGNKAILILADGSRLVLDSAATGKITEQGGTKVVKVDAGTISYTGSGGEAVGYNTISTPRGGQYRIELPDGTQVWLNATSSIKFPTQFTGDERRVEVTGEVYMEVARKSNQPFKVSTDNGAAIQVLGTRFNINAYKNESATTITLIDGSVKVKEKNTEVILKPGEQALVLPQVSPSINVHAANIDQVMAWKNGYFDLNADLPVIMRQLERWYDIEVVYENEIPFIQFFGSLDRNTPLEEVLKALEKSGVHMLLQGRRLTIKP